MCITCNIPIPISNKFIEKYNLPKNAIMTIHEFEDITKKIYKEKGLNNKEILDIFCADYEEICEIYKKYNHQTYNNYRWILKNISETKYGIIRSGYIVDNTSLCFETGKSCWDFKNQELN